MIVELLGDAILGAVAKSVVDEYKSSATNNNISNSSSNNNRSSNNNGNSSVNNQLTKSDQTKYLNILKEYAKKYQYRKEDLSDEIWHEMQLKTKHNISEIKRDYAKIRAQILKEANKGSNIKPVSSQSTKSDRPSTSGKIPANKNVNNLSEEKYFSTLEKNNAEDNITYNDVSIGNDWKFHDYVLSFNREDLVNLIENHYCNVKGTSPSIPKLGINGCIEFASALLLRNYMGEKISSGELDKDNCISAALQLNVAIGLAFLGKSPGEWSQLADVCAKNRYILKEREWSTVYLYLRDFVGDRIRQMEFNKGNAFSNSEKQNTALLMAENAFLDHNFTMLQCCFRGIGLNIL